jgi:hypothetical protein
MIPIGPPTAPEQRKNRVSGSRQNRREKVKGIKGIFGRGSWIRTNDLQYPKLPRYQAALYPDLCWEWTSIHAHSPASKAQGGLRGA